ncbi:hypothetical protein NC653_035056 [Populus alba x Populus x berolinensis]|uniref:Uncharacterized protein n=2 Tax=Populus alba x Populus x berolinensis TaxID=444605 RepID=A0AAD6LP55_9ROSI|nr:hypothetical protein NC653_035056 [Populus alba x Populus x berolinensis]
MHFFILRIVNEGDPVLACAILERKMQSNMHPPLHDQPRYSGDVHQGPILVSGVPNPNPIHPYAPRMAMRHVRVVAGKWSTGLCLCCDI